MAEVVIDVEQWERNPQLIRWLNSNGIDAGNVPLQSELHVVDGTTIHYTEFAKRENGARLRDERGYPVRVECTRPLLTDPARYGLTRG